MERLVPYNCFKVPSIVPAGEQVRGDDDGVLPRLHLHVQEGGRTPAHRGGR